MTRVQCLSLGNLKKPYLTLPKIFHGQIRLIYKNQDTLKQGKYAIIFEAVVIQYVKS